MSERRVGVLGSSSSLGTVLIDDLEQAGWSVVPVRRGKLPDPYPEGIPFWISAAPIWVLSEYFDNFVAHGAKRIVVVSSTSRWTKIQSSDASEREIASRIASAEEEFSTWAEGAGIQWGILRPTLVYGLGRDQNICGMVGFIRRFGFFPVLGAAQGLRQPIHVQDLALVCRSLLESISASNRAYDVSGAEVLSYQEMINRVFAALRRKPRVIHVPRMIFRSALFTARIFPKFRSLNVAMAERMNKDMVFDHTDAAKELGFAPRRFVLQPKDIECHQSM